MGYNADVRIIILPAITTLEQASNSADDWTLESNGTCRVMRSNAGRNSQASTREILARRSNEEKTNAVSLTLGLPRNLPRLHYVSRHFPFVVFPFDFCPSRPACRVVSSGGPRSSRGPGNLISD
ncbi:hypothetical protein NL676_032483 [Syzygium grande]|nr:hypothetical protein NL676_032483 [Syzygium grande]